MHRRRVMMIFHWGDTCTDARSCDSTRRRICYSQRRHHPSTPSAHRMSMIGHVTPPLRRALEITMSSAPCIKCVTRADMTSSQPSPSTSALIQMQAHETGGHKGKKSGKILFGQMDKYHVKFGHFVTFSYVYFRPKIACPQSWLSRAPTPMS